jgi:hypothetical protein
MQARNIPFVIHAPAQITYLHPGYIQILTITCPIP